MQTFMLSLNMKLEQQATFHQKVTSKRRGKTHAFYVFTHTNLFSMVYNFFWCIYFATFSKVG